LFGVGWCVLFVCLLLGFLWLLGVGCCWLLLLLVVVVVAFVFPVAVAVVVAIAVGVGGVVVVAGGGVAGGSPATVDAVVFAWV
jgi:hypothetical protein